MKLNSPDILAEVVSIATNDGRALEPESLDQFPALLAVGKQEFAAQLRLESDLVPGSTARVPIKFSDRLAAQPSFPVGTEFSIREPGYQGNGRVIEVYSDAEKGSVPSSHIGRNLGSAPHLVRPTIDPLPAMVAAMVAPTNDGEAARQKSWNPALTIGTFEGLEVADDAMTLLGTVNKTAILLAIVVIAALWAWSAPSEEADLAQFIWIGGLGGFFVALATIFIKTISPYTSPIYAALEGLALGAISAKFEAIHPGIAIQSVGLTFGTLVVLLILYRSGVIKVTQNFKAGIISATGAICLLYLVDIALIFSGKPISFIHESGPYGILFSLFVVTIAALNLVLDFDFVAQGVANKCPKYMEWYSAFGLVVTLVWLYLEILRLLAKRK